ncbi:MAG: hypothetical protein MJ211_08820 [Bacteroidales bacterium]|nr:hypothetical protein [Bacteroidales bacterium]
MDIQTIIKQILGLAEQVIKNPSKSVNEGGFDLGTIAKMAGSLFGGKSGIDLGALLGGKSDDKDDNPLGGLFGKKSDDDDNPLKAIFGDKDDDKDNPLGAIFGNKSDDNDNNPLGDILGGFIKSGLGNSDNDNSDLKSEVDEKSNTIMDMLKNSALNAVQKGNLTDMLNMLKTAKSFLGK